MPSIGAWVKQIIHFPMTQSHPESITFGSMEDVTKRAKASGRILIVYKDDVYDVTHYLDEHPGGKQILLMSNCKIVDKMFDKYHYPQGDGPKQLKHYKIGSLKPYWYLKSTNKVKSI